MGPEIESLEMFRNYIAGTNMQKIVKYMFHIMMGMGHEILCI